MKGLVFDTENQMQFKDFGEPLLDNLQKEVGGCIEVVHPKYLPEGLCMVIDDEGLLKGYAINSIASMFTTSTNTPAALMCGKRTENGSTATWFTRTPARWTRKNFHT